MREVIAPTDLDRKPGQDSRCDDEGGVENGYRDGLQAGRDDARRGDRFEPARANRYREGDHDYDRRYGPRDDYKREYRSAFEQGYREGYGRR